MLVSVLLQVLTFVHATNKQRIAQNLAPFRFADLYHSANRTPVSTEAGMVNMLHYAHSENFVGSDSKCQTYFFSSPCNR